jgi:predicted MFS family arabinose efflux permease
MTGTLALAGVAVMLWWVPAAPLKHHDAPRGELIEVLRHPALLRLDFGVFVLYAVQLAMWMAVPALLVQAGLPSAQHWQVYLPVVLGSLVVMGVTLFPLEKRGYLREVFLASVALVALVQAALFWSASHSPSVMQLGLLLFLFFCGFNILEASQPSMASRAAPPHSRGAALGVYNTLQSLGLFAGGVAGGWLVKYLGASGLFAVCAGAMLLWLVVAWPMASTPPAIQPGSVKAA